MTQRPRPANTAIAAAILHWLASHDRLAKPHIDALTTPELAAALDFATAAAGVACSGVPTRGTRRSPRWH